MPDALTIHAVDPVAFTRARIRRPSSAVDAEVLGRTDERLPDRSFDA
jgi:hypothetical protein